MTPLLQREREFSRVPIWASVGVDYMPQNVESHTDDVVVHAHREMCVDSCEGSSSQS